VDLARGRPGGERHQGRIRSEVGRLGLGPREVEAEAAHRPQGGVGGEDLEAGALADERDGVRLEGRPPTGIEGRQRPEHGGAVEEPAAGSSRGAHRACPPAGRRTVGGLNHGTGLPSDGGDVGRDDQGARRREGDPDGGEVQPSRGEAGRAAARPAGWTGGSRLAASRARARRRAGGGPALLIDRLGLGGGIPALQRSTTSMLAPGISVKQL
jgi:hypothetical protein